MKKISRGEVCGFYDPAFFSSAVYAAEKFFYQPNLINDNHKVKKYLIKTAIYVVISGMYVVISGICVVISGMHVVISGTSTFLSISIKNHQKPPHKSLYIKNIPPVITFILYICVAISGYVVKYISYTIYINVAYNKHYTYKRIA